MSTAGSPGALLHEARHAAAAGAEVPSRRDPSALEAASKSSDSDWVTAYDIAAERAVRSVIRDSRPHDIITGELGTAVPSGRHEGVRIRWSLDLLGGATNVIRDIVYFGTSVADDEDGTRLSDRYRVRRLAGPGAGRGRLPATGFSCDAATRAAQVGGLGALLQGFGDIRRLGSAALGLCMVADGGPTEAERLAAVTLAGPADLIRSLTDPTSTERHP